MRRNTTKKLDVSRDKYKCKVPGCDAELRSDKVKFHYEKRVCFEKFDKISELNGDKYVSTEELKAHTMYFRDMGWKSLKMIPSYKEHEIILSKGSQPIEIFMKNRVETNRGSYEDENNIDEIPFNIDRSVNDDVGKASNMREESSNVGDSGDCQEIEENFDLNSNECSISSSDFPPEIGQIDNNNVQTEPDLNRNLPCPSLITNSESSGMSTLIDTIVRKELMKALKGEDEYKEAHEETCKIISEAISVNINEARQQDVAKNCKIEDTWIVGEQFYSCLPCMKFKKNPNVPPA